MTEDQLNFLMRVLESAEGRAKMRMLLRGVIEEREDFVNSIEDVMYGNVKGEDEYVHMEDSNVSRKWNFETKDQTYFHTNDNKEKVHIRLTSFRRCFCGKDARNILHQDSNKSE